MFEEFLGNDELKEEISALLESDSFPHAVFFSGEEGTGCDFFARLVAAEYLRDHSSLVMRNVHPDFVSVQGSGSSGQVSVSDVREALYEMNKAAVMTDGRRVLHIRQAENLNAYSANALLKMMEEPPEGVVFILTVRRQDDLMPTIRSRAVGYRIRQLDAGLCADEAVKRIPGLGREKAESLSELFGGRLGLVLRAAEDQKYSFCVLSAEKLIDAVFGRSRYGIMAALAAAENRDQLSLILRIALSGIARKVEKDPENADFSGYVYECIMDALEQTDAFVNAKTAAAVLAARVAER
ncbi:MAG: hypothetical protein II643_00130 [Oscillospiraceae bacterium]|nr:hypothetical protein [Oscillospiraceae bacterium]